MNFLVKFVLAVCCLSTTCWAANYVEAEIQSIDFQYEPEKSVMKAGDVIHVNPEVCVNLTNHGSEAKLVWVKCHMRAGDDAHSRNVKGVTVKPGETAVVKLHHCHLIASLYVAGEFTFTIDVKVTLEYMNQTTTVLASDSKNDTVVATGNPRRICKEGKPDDLKGGVNIMPRLTGPKNVIVAIAYVFVLHENMTFYNPHGYDIKITYRVTFKDQDGHHFECWFCIYIPSNCHGQLAWWFKFWFTYRISCVFEFFGWAAACYRPNLETACGKFNHWIDATGMY